jgi:hypothetical protein
MDKSVCMVNVLYTQKYLNTVLNFGSDSNLLIFIRLLCIIIAYQYDTIFSAIASTCLIESLLIPIGSNHAYLQYRQSMW